MNVLLSIKFDVNFADRRVVINAIHVESITVSSDFDTAKSSSIIFDGICELTPCFFLGLISSSFKDSTNRAGLRSSPLNYSVR